MKYLCILLAAVLICPSASYAQRQSTEEEKSNYIPSEAFAPIFYTNNGNEYRSSNGAPGPRYWQNRADYTISATLDTQENTINAKVAIKYKNNSPDALPYLWLQLDQNMFKKTSRGSAITPPSSRYGEKNKAFNGGYDIKNIKLSNLKGVAKFTHLIEDTRMQIRLESPLRSGESIDIVIDYSYTIPEHGSDRTGYVDTKNGKIFAIAQWFPRMCVYDDILGWNTLPYWGAGEFYCEYGDITFSITAPSSQIVAGSGELLNANEVFTPEFLRRWNSAKQSDSTVRIRTEADIANASSLSQKGKLTWKFKIKNARDAAWASSKAFLVDGARINLPSGKKSFALSVYPAESKDTESYGRSVEFVKGSIEHYSKMWYEYPYPMAINVAAHLNGMEYPGIVFCNFGWKGSLVWDVIDHEFGHIWFPMIVGSNERKYGWMDEGFNTFINGISSENFNHGEFRGGNMDMHSIVGSIFGEIPVANIIGNPAYENIMLIPDAMTENNIGVNLYAKPSWALNILRNQILGKERFDYAFRSYIKNWAYKHPTPFDFFRAMENAAGEDLSWFWRSWFFNNWKMDQGIESVERDSNEYKIKVNNLDKMPLPIILEITTESGKKDTLRLPVEVWMKNISWTIHYPTTEKISHVELDPEHVFPDANSTNNDWPSNDTAISRKNDYIGTYFSVDNPSDSIQIAVSEKSGRLTLRMNSERTVYPLRLLSEKNSPFGKGVDGFYIQAKEYYMFFTKEKEAYIIDPKANYESTVYKKK